MLANRIKVYRDAEKYECYEIEKISKTYYVKRLYDKGWLSRNWKVIGKSDSYENAMNIVRSDAKNNGTIYKIKHT